jgi:hypothetical protein
MALQVKRGTNLQRQELILAAGELFYVTNAVALGISPLFVGDGVSYGGIATLDPAQLDDLTDVAIENLIDNQVLQYDTTGGQWRNSSNLLIDGTTTLNGATTANALTTVNITDTNSVSRPAVVRHSYSNRFLVESISRQALAPFYILVNGTGMSVVAAGTPFRFTSIPSAYAPFLSTTTTYYIFDSTALQFKIAATYSDAIAGIGIASSVVGIQSFSVQTFATLISTDISAGIQYQTNDFNGGTAVAQAITDAKKISTSEGRYQVYVRNGSAIPATPQFEVYGNGDITITGSINAGTVGGTTVSVTGQIATTDTTQSTTTGTGSIVTAGGVGIAKDVRIGGAVYSAGAVNITNTTQSTDINSGALIVDGGVGIEKRLNVAGDTNITATTTSTSTTTGALKVAGGVGIAENLNVAGVTSLAGDTNITATTASSSTTTGALKVAGGVGVAGTVYATAGNFASLTVSGNLTIDGTTTTINSTTITVDDKNIELGSVATPTDTTANGGGITLKGTTDKTIIWNQSTNSWEFNKAILAGDGGFLGTVKVGQTAANSITTSAGNLVLDGFSGIITSSSSIDTTNYVEAGLVRIGDDYGGFRNRIRSMSGELVLAAASTEQIRVQTDNPLFVESTLTANYNFAVNGSVTTDLAFSNSGTSQRGIRGTVGTNDYWFVGGDASGTSAGQLIIATADDGAEPIVARQYIGQITDANSNYRELVLMDADGNTALAGRLTAGNITIADTNDNTIASTTGNIVLSAANKLQITNDVMLPVDVTIEWNEGSVRTNRPNFQSANGNTSGIRVLAPTTATAGNAQAVITALNSGDYDNGDFIAVQARDSADAFRIQTGSYTAGSISASGLSVNFYDNTTKYASVNPSGPTDSTDLITKTYLEAGTSELAQVKLDNRAVLDTATLTTTATTADQVADSFDAATYRSAKYLVQIASGTDYQSVECLIIHNGTTASITTYADIKTGSTNLATFGTDISSGSVRLLTTPTNAATTYKVVRTLITA